MSRKRPGAQSAPSTRQQRVGEEIRHALSRIVAEGNLRDPGLAGRIVTVSEVRMSPDLRVATVFVSPFGDGDASALVAALRRARSFLRQRIAAAVKLRHAPELRFEPDRGFEAAGRIEILLRRTDSGVDDGET